VDKLNITTQDLGPRLSLWNLENTLVPQIFHILGCQMGWKRFDERWEFVVGTGQRKTIRCLINVRRPMPTYLHHYFGIGRIVRKRMAQFQTPGNGLLLAVSRKASYIVQSAICARRTKNPPVTSYLPQLTVLARSSRSSESRYRGLGLTSERTHVGDLLQNLTRR